MTDVVGRMVLHLPLVRISEIVELMSARGRHSLDFLTVFQRDALPETPVENRDEVMQEIAIALAGNHLEQFVGKRLFLNIKQVGSQFADCLSPLKCGTGDLHLPEPFRIDTQCIVLPPAEAVGHDFRIPLRRRKLRLIQMRSRMKHNTDSCKHQGYRQNTGKAPQEQFEKKLGNT